VIRFLRIVPLFVLLAGTAACDVPLGAIRRSPPSGIDARVKSADTPAPDINLMGTQGAFLLSGVLAQENALLVFYRGHW
jgi:hypothetical protein